MHTTFDPIRAFIAEQLLNELEAWQERAAGHGLTVQSIHDALVTPPQAAMGDLAFPCFPLAKALKTAPPKIAAELAKGLAARTEDRVGVSAAGPYVNFVVRPEIFGRDLLEPVLSGEFFSRKLTTGNPRTMVEYSQPNTHKEIHVGHMRNASLGDALVRLLRYAGTDVVSATFPGDVGTHVAKCLWYLKHHNQEAIPSEGKGEWLGLIYTRANQKLEDEVESANE